ncbi:MAG: TrkH family potassium uptake protein [Gemmiger sp.]
MNYRMLGYVLGRIFVVEAALMLLPVAVAFIYGEMSCVPAFLIPLAILALLGYVLGHRAPADTAIYAREGLVIVALSWVLMSVFGALPFVISGEIPSFVDAFFETVSGFTTTGASILRDVEALSQSMLFWRSLTHWVGGMGVLVFAMAVLPMTDGRAMHLMRAEVPGPSVGKISSKLRDTAKILYAIYFVMTIIEVVLLCLGGLPLYDSLITSFGTAGTGGFSNRSLSIGAYNSTYVEMVTAVFMLLFGINFNLYYFLLMRHFKEAFGSEELRAYLGVVALSTAAIAANIYHIYQSVGQSLRYAFFQVASIITTTGFATTDFNLWPTFSKAILVILMFFGACAGSTGGGLKISRIIIMCKAAHQDMMRVLHPHAVTTVRFEGKPLENKTVSGVHIYMNLYILICVLSMLIVAFDQFDLITTFTAVASCLNNIGPGLEIVGPMGNFADFSILAKLLLSFDMLVGRLEIFPMLVLFAPTTWLKRRRVRSKSAA